MNDLISRTALLHEFETENACHSYNLWHITGIKAFIENVPAVDVKSVVHGKWKRQTDYNENDNAVFECSNCMHGDIHARSAIVPFCWYCGARMDGE